MSEKESEPWKASILVVEDDPDQLFLYQQILAGHKFTSVTTAKEALAALEESVPNLIILDHILADGDLGTDLLPVLRSNYSHVPVVIVSGTLDIKGQLQALQGPYAAHYVIEKPVDVQTLRSTVQQALDECGVGEAVRSIRSLERAEMIKTNEPERVFAERLARQHELFKRLREGKETANVSALSREFNVHRRTISRDLTDLINRGQLDPKVYAEYKPE